MIVAPCRLDATSDGTKRSVMSYVAAHAPCGANRPTPTTRRPSRRHLAAGGMSLALAGLLGTSVLVGAAPAYAAQAAVGLGTAGSFAVLAGSGITNTGPTTITGDVGTFPTPTETGFGSVTLTGTNHGGDAVSQGAKNDLVVAYNDAAGRRPVTNVAVELGGTTLLAGVYTSPTLGLTGTLTLDAQGRSDAQFIFLAGSTLIAESNSRVLLLNGADPCRVVWQVGSSATFKTGTSFVGDVLAYTSITALTRATFRGRLLARNGAVTLDTNTITRSDCSPRGGGTTVTSVAGTPSVGTTGTTGGTTTVATSGTTSQTTGSRGSNPSVPPGSPGSGPLTPLVPQPATPPPRTVSGPPSLARTGVDILVMLAAGLMLTALGATTLAAGRRSRLADVSAR